jgi:type IV secretion system protein VirB8
MSTNDLSPEMQQRLKQLTDSGLNHDAAEAARQAAERILFKRLFIGMTAAFCVAVSGYLVLLPLKTVETRIVRVDVANNLAEVVHATGDRSDWKNPDEFFLRRYVAEREGYIHGLRRESYRRVTVMSSGQCVDDYKSWFKSTNPESPQNVYGEYLIRRIKVVSVSDVTQPGAPNRTAIVRFTAWADAGDDRQPRLTSHAATIEWNYTEPSTNKEELEINPLGFKCKAYRVESETGVAP